MEELYGKKKQLKELTIKDNFMFGAVMMDEENCKGLLERVLQIKIDYVEISKEKSIVYHPEYKGVRLDVYAKDENHTCYNVEMQVQKKSALGKRIRYYQSQMDMEMLLTGEDYAELPNTYVIFIYDFDPIGEGKYRYTFRTKCEELLGMNLEDGRTIVFLNTHGKNESEVPKELVTLLKYIREDIDGSEREFHDSYVERLQKFIHEIKSNREMEERFMIFEEMLKDERAEGREEGLALGLENAKSTLLLCLQSFGTVSETICDQIQSQQELEVLKQWTKIAFQSKSLEEFEKKISL
ncbi:MAG: Rpn family recombination-promoting nuclease/putative transposase [Clostridiales bacterium]|nr:Rpn family recombination-promoting nuclease/putative transposase [Clostridiales bacterium]